MTEGDDLEKVDEVNGGDDHGKEYNNDYLYDKIFSDFDVETYVLSDSFGRSVE